MDQEVDTSDFAAALTQPETLSRFVVVEHETELAAILNAPLAQWRVFLHPTQRRLVQGSRSGPVRVLGGAGTGKTVVAMHRAKWLAENWLAENRKILVTTFTRNLATDILGNLKQICGPETLAKIEVTNLDAWVHRFLQKRRYAFEIVYGVQADAWQRALALKPAGLSQPDSFYREEWERIIQPQGIDTLDEYKRAPRSGRGTVLGRSDRVRLWPVFEEYRNQLTRAKKKEVDDAYRDAAALLSNGPGTLPYDAIVVDEAQDMGPQAFRLLRAMVKGAANDLFIVGDGHQRIYGRHKVVLSKCGVDIRGRAKKLRINYRTTEEIRRVAVRLLEGRAIDDLDGGPDDQVGYRSLIHGEVPAVRIFPSIEEEARAIADIVAEERRSDRESAGICVIARTKDELDKIEKELKPLEIPYVRVQADPSDSSDADSIRTATMHRVKGLEFDTVIVASVNDGLVPLTTRSGTIDPVEAAMRDTEERSLLYVSLTRARRKAVILGYGKLSPYVASSM